MLYLIHLNGNSLLPRIDKLRNIAQLSNAAFIGTNESKLDDSILLSGIHIDNYNTPCCDRGRIGGWIVCYVRKDLSYDVKSFFFFFVAEIENISFELLLPNMKPIVVGIIYERPIQSELLKIKYMHFSKLDTKNS